MASPFLSKPEYLFPPDVIDNGASNQTQALYSDAYNSGDNSAASSYIPPGVLPNVIVDGSTNDSQNFAPGSAQTDGSAQALDNGYKISSPTTNSDTGNDSAN